MLACRYMGNTGDAVKLLLHRQANVCVCCDAGKTPMHDLCWMIRTEEQFELFKLVMFAAGPPRNLLLVEDHHGQTPLDYLPEDLYEKCNAFIEQHKNVFWPRVELKPAQTAPSASSGAPASSNSKCGSDAMHDA